MKRCYYCKAKFSPTLLVQHLFRVHRFSEGFWGKYGIYDAAKRKAGIYIPSYTEINNLSKENKS